ncbi:MAG: TonB-dependent receptor [Alcanivoracaceae bacterium]|nr:TonB-dependent receptor [Alcanivoracaceae bacterium]
MRSITALTGLCLVLSMPALSADPGLAADDGADVPMVLTPARLRQPVAEVPASVTVIDRETIEASGAREIYQVLQLVPGMAALDVDGNVPTVSYHPTQARDIRRMLVLIDGRSLYQSGLARVLWNDFPLEIEDVERIEVTRGPAAAAYGANAFSAVINIISRHPRDVVGTEVSVRAGSNGILDRRLTSAHASDSGALRMTVARRDDDGYDEPFDDDPLVDGVPDDKTIETFNLRYAHELNLTQSFEVLAGGSRTSLARPIEEGFTQVMEITRPPEVENERSFLQLRYNHDFSARNQLKVQLYGQSSYNNAPFGGCMISPVTGKADSGGGVWFSEELRDLFEQNDRDIDATIAAFGSDPAVGARLTALYSYDGGNGAGALCPTFDFAVREKRYDLEVQDTAIFTDWLRLVMGANLRQDRIESETYIGGKDSNASRRVFGNLETRLPAGFILNLGGYWEKDQINGEFFSPRYALTWLFLPEHSLRFVYSESLRTMDIYEINADVHLKLNDANGPYRTDPQGTLGWSDPEFFVTQRSLGLLDPEEIVSREVGYFGRFGALALDIRVFEEELRNLVSGALNPFVFDPNNNGEVDLRGREAQLSWRMHRQHLLRLAGAHIHTEARNPVWSQIQIEERLAARDSASLLWRYDISRRWMASTGWYFGAEYNDYRYERGDFNLVHRMPVADAELQLGLLVQKKLVKDPVVFEENAYDDDDRYWLTAAVTF